jgi:G protein-coupled glucose receptor regulating Gpa2
VQSLGLVLVGDHLRLNSVLPGSVCTLQGFLINSGDIASAIWSFVIAAHTFFLLAGGRGWRSWVAEKSMSGKFRWFLCVGIWLFVLFISTIGLWLIEKIHPERGPFCMPNKRIFRLTLDNNAGAGWCWIDQAYFWERIFFHYSKFSP